MKEKVIQNKGIITLIAAIVSAALLVPSFISFFGDEINDVNVVRLVIYCLILTTDLLFICYYVAKKEFDLKALIAPVIIFYGAGITSNIFDTIKYNSWTAVFYAALYAAVLILYLIYYFNTSKNINIALYVLLLICIVFNVLGVFTGSAIECSRLIINLIIIGNLYLIPQGGDKE